MKKTMIFLTALLTVLPLAAQHENKAVLSTDSGEQQLNTNEIQRILFDGGRVTVVQPWGETVYDRTLRELTFLRPLPGTVRLTVDATIGSDAESVSRRALSLGGDGKVRSTWEAGDQVFVYADAMSTTAVGTLTPETTGSATSRLVGDVSVGGLTNGQTLYLSTMPRPHTFAAQTGRLEDIFFATAQSQLTIVEANASLANTTFANAQAITRFTMKDGYGNDVSVSQLDITGGAGTITVTPAAAMTELYVAMPATAAQTTYSFTATAADGVRSGVKTANVQQGNYYRTSVTVKLTASVSAAPTAVNWLTYNGGAQTLVNAGTPVGGTMHYAVTTTNSQPNSGFSTTIPTGINYGTYYVWYYVEGDADHHSSGVAGPVTVSIAQKALTITAKAQTVNYGTAITNNTNQITADGLYSGHSITAVTLTQSRTNAGSGTITPSAATVKDGSGNTVTSNYSITYNTGVLTVNTVPASVASAPTAKSGLVYNGSAQTLVNSGSGSGGTMYYKVTTSNSRPSDTNGFSTTATATDAGTYYVWYYVGGDSNHTDTGVSSTAVTITIGKANASITQNPSGKSLTYNGSAQTLINAGSNSGGTMKYSLDASNWYTSVDDIKGTNAGTYTFYYKVDGDSNYNGVSQKSSTATIGQKSLSITANDQTVNYGTGISTGTGQISASGLCSGHGVTAITLSQSRTDAGSGTITPSAATVMTGYTDVTSNYSITYYNGTLTVNKVAGSITCNTSSLSFASSNGANSTATKTGVSGSGGTISVSSSNTGNCTVSYANGTITVTRQSESAWTETITVSLSPDANHTAPNNVTFTVSATACDPGIDLSSVTSGHIGWIIGANGKAYPSINSANSYSSARAMIAYIGDPVYNNYRRGLAIALEDYGVYSIGNEICYDSYIDWRTWYPASGCEWTVGTDWQWSKVDDIDFNSMLNSIGASPMLLNTRYWMNQNTSSGDDTDLCVGFVLSSGSTRDYFEDWDSSEYRIRLLLVF